MSGRFHRGNRHQFRGGRGRTPSIYSNLNNNLTKGAILDCRFSEVDNSSNYPDQPTWSSTLETDNDPFQASLNEFLKQEKDRKEQQIEGSNVPGRFQPYKSTKEFPQDKRYFCDKCFRGYNTEFMYTKHLETHIKCTYEGCKFEANSWFLAKHITNVHEMGISSLGSQSRNEKWIEQRKRNFPSQAAVEEKQKIEQEKYKRGEVLVATNAFGKFKIETPSNLLENHSKAEKPAFFAVSSKESLAVTDSKPSTSKSDKSSENPFDKNDDFDEKAPAKLKNLITEAEKLRAEGKLQSLANKRKDWEKSSLLEQLLKDDIVKERNILLQCIRFIVSKNFFDKTS